MTLEAVIPRAESFKAGIRCAEHLVADMGFQETLARHDNLWVVCNKIINSLPIYLTFRVVV